MKSTILSEKDIKLIEKVIIQYGRIVNIHDLLKIFGQEYTKASSYKRINILAKAGWFHRIKRGLYLVIDSLTSRSQIDVSLLKIANVLMIESYVSLSYALNYYQMFDQYSNMISSVTFLENKKYLVDNYIFKFSKVKKNMYFGFTERLEAGNMVRIADAEKALIDYLYLDKSFGSTSLVFEKIKDYKQDMDIKKLEEYALRFSITIQRVIGFMLDELDIDSNILYQTVKKNNRGASYLTKDSKKFNAKWRLYYDDRIIR